MKRSEEHLCFSSASLSPPSFDANPLFSPLIPPLHLSPPPPPPPPPPSPASEAGGLSCCLPGSAAAVKPGVVVSLGWVRVGGGGGGGGVEGDLVV